MNMNMAASTSIISIKLREQTGEAVGAEKLGKD
jgi:hypothetical protein